MTKYCFNFLWVKVTNATSIFQLAYLSSAAILIVYLSACATLYAFSKLTGLLTFSWLNGLYTMILLGMIYIFIGHMKPS